MKNLFSSFIVALAFLTSSISADSFQYINNAHTYQDNVGKINIAGYVNRLTSFIADQLNQNKNFDDIEDIPMAILSIVAMNDFKKTSPITKRISENLIHEMHVRGYKVIDYKAMSQIEVDENGDYLFSRAIKDLKNQRMISYALSGTYTTYKDGIAINCRIIDIKTSVVLSTAQVFVPTMVLKSVEKLHAKNTWYSESSHTLSNNTVAIKGK